MDENLRQMFDDFDWTMSQLRRLVNELDQLCYALHEEAEENLKSDEIGPMMAETLKRSASVGFQSSAVNDVIHAIAKEILK